MFKLMKHLLVSMVFFGLFTTTVQIVGGSFSSNRHHALVHGLNPLNWVETAYAGDNRRHYKRHHNKHYRNKAGHRSYHKNKRYYGNKRYYNTRHGNYYKNKRYYKNRGYYKNGRVVKYRGNRYYRHYDNHGYRYYPVYYNRPYYAPRGCFYLNVNGGYISICSGYP